MIDAHAHLHDQAFNDDRDSVVKRALEAGVEKIITIGTDIEESKRGVECAQKYPSVYASVGLHPHEFIGGGSYHDDEVGTWIEELELIAKQPKVIAIGECGLDYFSRNPEYPVRDSEKDRQKKVFEKQIDLAKKLGLPVIVHCREAYEDLAEIIASVKQPPKIVVHCHEGNMSQTKTLLDLGCFFSFTGNITYKEKIGSERDEMIRMVPIERILTETDAPYLAPVPHRGDRNESMYIPFVVKKIAERKGFSEEDVEQQVTKNFLEVFGV